MSITSHLRWTSRPLAVTDLLGFVEAMNLVDEQDGPPLAEPQLVLRLLDHLSHLAGRRAGGRQSHEARRALPFTRAGDNVGQSRLRTYKPLGQISPRATTALRCFFFFILLLINLLWGDCFGVSFIVTNPCHEASSFKPLLTVKLRPESI